MFMLIHISEVGFFGLFHFVVSLSDFSSLAFSLAVRADMFIIIIYFFSYKNVESNSEQVLAATPDKAPTIRSPTTYYENYPS